MTLEHNAHAPSQHPDNIDPVKSSELALENQPVYTLAPQLDSPEVTRLLKNYKMTPATMAYKFENLHVPPGGKLRWHPAAHLMYISLRVAQAIARGNARLIISAPPRHGKSKLCTHYGPLWVLENFANFAVTLVTYGADLSEDFARDVRETINTAGSLLDVKTETDKISKFLTNKGGSMTSIGLMGAYTGRGSNVLFIDDYIKTMQEAMSPTERQKVWDWFVTTPMTRLEPDASVIIIATRWHHDDLIGRLVKNYPDDWEYISIPALAEEDDLLGREPGEALFPQRFGVKSLLKRKELFGSLFFDAIYQQKPHEDTGKYAKREWLTPVNQLPNARMRLLRVWDLAGTDDDGDFCAGGLLALDLDTWTVYLLNMIRMQYSPMRVETKIQEVAEVDGPHVEILIEQEPGSSGKAVVEHYIKRVLKGYRVKAFYSSRNKLVRAQPFLAACEAGKFKICSAPWNEDFLKEFETFPPPNKKGHDDQVDVCAAGYEHLTSKLRLSVSWGRHSIVTQEEVDSTLDRQRNLLNPGLGQGHNVSTNDPMAPKARASFGATSRAFNQRTIRPIPQGPNSAALSSARSIAQSQMNKSTDPTLLPTARLGLVRGATFGRR